jgi:hypothetical protein
MGVICGYVDQIRELLSSCTVLSSTVWLRVVWYMCTRFSDDPATSIFMVNDWSVTHPSASSSALLMEAAGSSENSAH